MLIRRNIARSSLIFYGMVLLLLPLQAQDSTSLDLGEVVITAQHQAGRADQAIQQITVIDRDRIEAQAAQSLPDLLQTQLGIRITEDPSTGTRINLQGLEGQQIKILVDGVPVVGRLDGNVDLSQLPLQNVERIELIEGPLSVEYGTNALGGVINLITRRPSSRSLSVNASILEGLMGNGWSPHEGQHNQDLTVSLAGKHLQSTFSAGRYFTGGRYEDRLSRGIGFNPKRQSFASAGLSHRGNNWNLSWKSQVFDELLLQQGEPEGIYQITALDERLKSFRQQHQLEGSYRWDNHWNWSGFAALSTLDRNRQSVFVDLVNLEENELGQPVIETFRGWSARGTFTRSSILSKHSLQIGYDLLRETISGGKIEANFQDQHDLAAFASLELNLTDKLVVRPGLRAAWNDAYPAPLTPSLNLRYQTGDITWRGSWARGFRAPSLKELYLDFVDVNHNLTGNPSLGAESGDYCQVSGSWKKLTRSTLFRSRLSGFYNQINNRIELALSDPETNAYTYLNLEEVTLAGFSGQVSARQERWSVQTGINYVARQTPDRQWLPSCQVNGSASVEMFSDMTASLFYQYQGISRTFTRSIESEAQWELLEIAPYHWLDINLAKEWGESGLRTAIGARNLLDVMTVAASGAGGGAHSGGGSSLISTGRSLFFRMTWAFDKDIR